MTETIISSATKEVVHGFERPFVIIGERIYPVTGSKPKSPLEIPPVSDSQCAGLASGTAPDRHCFRSLASES